MGFQSKITTRLPSIFGILIFNALLLISFRTPRSWGGDFWLHLFLIRQQAEGIREHGWPNLLISFVPNGDLSIVSLFSGGLSYSFLGLISIISGFSIYWCAILLIVLLCNSLYVNTYRFSKLLGINENFSALLGFIPLGFGWVFGDGLGRGALSSMIAGILTINALLFFFQGLLEKNAEKRFRVFVGTVVCVGLVGATHLPSFVILLFFGFPMGLISSILLKRNFSFALRYSGLAFGLGALSSAMYWLPATLWSLSSTFSMQHAFQRETSSAFASSKVLFGLGRSVPESHDRAWESWVGKGFEGSTSLIVSQPSLLIVLAILILVKTKKMEVFLGVSHSISISSALYNCNGCTSMANISRLHPKFTVQLPALIFADSLLDSSYSLCY